MNVSLDIVQQIVMYTIAIIYMLILGYFTLRYLIFPKAILNLSSNPIIKKGDYKTMDEYKYNKTIDKVPSKSRMVTVVLLRENKWAKILYFDGTRTHFRYSGCIYFICTPHTCDNNAKLLIYIEGVSLPVSYENIQKEHVKRRYIDLDGTVKEKEITVIKGLKWDGKILNLFTDRKFAEIFTKQTPEIILYVCMILGIVAVVMIGICTGVSYYFK